MTKDIFISYKNDNAGNNFANRLKDDLEKSGYSVYFNSHENRRGDFPERLRNAVKGCKDFVLIVSQGCLDQLIRNEKIDWIREELLTAKAAEKNIIPIFMDGVSMPADKDVMPEALRFLPDTDGLSMPEQYQVSPFEQLLKNVSSKPEKDDIYRDTCNSNKEYNIKAEFKKLLTKAEEGDYAAMYELANLYYYGFCNEDGDTVRDFDKAYMWLKRLVDDNSEYQKHAESIIGEMYFRGVVTGEPHSYKKSLKLHESAREISGFSAREYAYASSRGYGCEFDYEKIEANYKTAVSKGDKVAVNGLARFYMDYGKYTEAAKLYESLSSENSEAKFKLGMLYRNGLLSDPPKPDFFKAAVFLEDAIHTGYRSAEVYYELGRLYFTPMNGFPKNFKRAQEYFKVAADKGEKNAQYRLGVMYEFGYVEKNKELAIHYHYQAAEQGVALAAYHLALLYQDYEKNYHKAYRYAKKAADCGNMEGEYLLGMFLYMGRGCKADKNKAYEYFKKAYEDGMLQAKIMIDKIESSGDDKNDI